MTIKEEKIKLLFNKVKSVLPQNIIEEFEEKFKNDNEIPPKVALIGKSGVGKTTTINNLFGVDWHTSEVVTGTKVAQEEVLQLSDGSKITIIDMPGLGDSIKNDEIFMEIYKEKLPYVDVVLYIIQADDGAIKEDERIIKDIISNCGKNIKKKFAIGINKVDLLGNGKNMEWREDLNLPSEEQEELIEKKGKEIILSLSKYTGIKKEAIAYYSAQRRYNLFDLLNVVIMQSGKMGWKFSVIPKDWKELCTSEIQDLTLSDKSPAS